ncbi:hypothetical protein LLE49_02645 [Alicyclobacillus tolerans]|uniref:lipoate--protein ligase family protein n=1 Tax=Alicyclobacillus tolerans TaxID=90970 RepID=UPI001F3CFBF1|nr:hypothetical protein [Alicyclobacillus tolerans]MCF8563637.1 hypothetical protein [Alicyclobacillus tolerans]
MENLPLYLLGELDWITTQTIYHAMAHFGREGIVLCWPRTPYVSLGCHQSFSDYDETSGLPVIRRKVGGSLVYLDARQIFFQVIANPERCPNCRTPDSWYHYALDPVVDYLKQLGLPASLHPPADILIGGQKVSGNAGGLLDEQVVIVGNLLLDFSVDVMARVRSAPHPVWRKAFADSMAKHLTTLKEWLPTREWSTDRVMNDLAEVFSERLCAVATLFPWESWRDKLERTGRELTQPHWLMAPARNRRNRVESVKVREGVYLRTLIDPVLPPVVAEVDVMNHSLLRVWGLPEHGESLFEIQDILDQLLPESHSAVRS